MASIDIDSMSVEELDALIKRARQLKSQKATPSIKINGYVASVGKHVNGALEAIKKLMTAEGVSQKKWDDVEAHLSRIQIDMYRQEAEKVKVRPRTFHGTRRRKRTGE